MRNARISSQVATLPLRKSPDGSVHRRRNDNDVGLNCEQTTLDMTSLSIVNFSCTLALAPNIDDELVR